MTERGTILCLTERGQLLRGQLDLSQCAGKLTAHMLKRRAHKVSFVDEYASSDPIVDLDCTRTYFAAVTGFGELLIRDNEE